MGRLSNLRVVDPVLTNLMRGYSNAELIYLSLLPLVYVDKEAGKVPKFGVEAFKLFNTERALRASSNRILPEDIGTDNYALTEHDLEYPIDYREDADAALPLQSHAARTVKGGVQLRFEVAVASMFQTPGNYAASNRVALAGTTCWSNPASAPLTQLRTARDAVRGRIGKRPNVCAMGPASFTAIAEHASVLDRIKYTQTGVLTPELLGSLIGMKVVVGEAVKADDQNVKSDIWLDNCVLAYVAPAPADGERSEYDPSVGYTFMKRNSAQVDTRTEGGKVELVRYTEIAQPKVLGWDAAYLIENTVA